MRKAAGEPLPLLRTLLTELGLALLLAVLAFAAVKVLNRRMGLEDPGTPEAGADSTPVQDGRVLVPGIEPREVSEDVFEPPEAAWPSTPCSLFVSAASSAVLESLPEAPETGLVPYEALLLARSWAELAGFDEAQTAQVYLFSRLDTLYLDAPGPYDPEGFARTVEGRFACFTRLFPMVSGSPMPGYPDGIAVRGVPGIFGER